MLQERSNLIRDCFNITGNASIAPRIEGGSLEVDPHPKVGYCALDTEKKNHLIDFPVCGTQFFTGHQRPIPPLPGKPPQNPTKTARRVCHDPYVDKDDCLQLDIVICLSLQNVGNCVATFARGKQWPHFLSAG